MSKPKKNREKARQIKGLGNSGLKKNFIFFLKPLQMDLYRNKIGLHQVDIVM